MSNAQLFKAPPLVNPIDPDTLSQAQDCMDSIVAFFYQQPESLPSIFRSVMEVNCAVGNSLYPPHHLTPIVDQLAVVAKQLPIIISEMHEMVSGGITCLSEENDAAIEEFINGVADTQYTIMGLAARLGDNNHRTSYGTLFGDILRFVLGSYYTEIMEGVCGEQSSKFILENEIPHAIELFAAKGIEISITPDGSGRYVIKSAKDQIVNGEHYPSGKWLKGPKFERYKLPEHIVTAFKNNPNFGQIVSDPILSLYRNSAKSLLTEKLDSLNGYIVHYFGEEWKMNLTKRDEMYVMIEQYANYHFSKTSNPTPSDKFVD